MINLNNKHEIIAFYRTDEKPSKKIASKMRISPEVIEESEHGFDIDDAVKSSIQANTIREMSKLVTPIAAEKIKYYLREIIESDFEGMPDHIVWKFPLFRAKS